MGRRPYEQSFAFQPRAAHLFATNALPSTRDYSRGFWRRFIVLPFEQEFDGKTRSADILATFKDETRGMVAWAMTGAVRALAQRGYSETAQSTRLKEQWQVDADPVATFLKCCTDKQTGHETRAAEMYSHFRAWCERAGRQSITATTFGTRLKNYRIQKTRRAAGVMYLARVKPMSEWEFECTK